MIVRIVAFLVNLLLGQPRRAGASAEWCEHDDLTRHTVVDGQHVNVRVKIAGLTMRETMRDWTQNSGGNVRIVAPPDPDGIGLLIVGPPCKWRVERIEGNHGFALDSQRQEYVPGESVVFTLHR